MKLNTRKKSSVIYNNTTYLLSVTINNETDLEWYTIIPIITIVNWISMLIQFSS